MLSDVLLPVNMESLKIDQDCTYYYTSKCSNKACPFRHEPAALNCYVTCSFWRKRKCSKKHCEYRHTELKREEIPCYWEGQPEGCQKDDCPFQHSEPHVATRRRPRSVRSQSLPWNAASNSAPTRRARAPSAVPCARSASKDNKRDEKNLKKKLKEMEKKLKEKDEEKELLLDTKRGEKNLRKKLKVMEKKLKEKDKEKERVLKIHQEELDAQTSFTLQALQDELEASVNASTTCMSATKDVILTVGRTMREEFECKICFELFISPMTLSCSHSFCEYCINKWRTHSKNCPTCLQMITSQSRARAVENFIERMVSNLTEDMKERRREIMTARLESAS